MNTLEQDLRRELAQTGDTPAARAAAAREEALRELASGARRARVRRLTSACAAGAVIAGAGVLLVMSLPRGQERTATGTVSTDAPGPVRFSVLDRPPARGDRLLPQGAAGGSVDVSSARRIGTVTPLRFFATRSMGGGVCAVIARPQVVPAFGGAVPWVERANCIGGDVYRYSPVVMVAREWGDEDRVAVVVPDGITEVRFGDRRERVQDNAVVATLREGVPRVVTLVGPGADAIRVIPDSGVPEYRRGQTAGGTPTVTLPAVQTARTPPGRGVLRGTRLAAVQALPSLVRLTPGLRVTLGVGQRVRWRVSVLNGGDRPERDVTIVVSLRYPGGAVPVDVRTAAIPMIPPGRAVPVEIEGPPRAAIRPGHAGSLIVQVLPVPGEQNTQNNAQSLPVRFG